MFDVIVIGAGPAGMMAAYAASNRGLKTAVFDKNEKVGKKLFLTGKGRCNITNVSSDFFSNIVRNPKFLLSCYNNFSNMDLIQLFNRNGLATKVERGGRVFPQSDKSSDVIKTLSKITQDVGVKLHLHSPIKHIEKKEGQFLIGTRDGEMACRSLVIATGGLSYPSTGSTGDAFRWAHEWGHSVIALRPALVPLVDKTGICQKMQGLTLKNIRFTLFQNNKEVYAEQGEMLFTHFGLSGPVVLSASSFIHYDQDISTLMGEIDLKPALTQEQLDARLLRDFDQNKNKQLKTYLPALMPAKLETLFFDVANIDPEIRIHEISREVRGRIVQTLKGMRIAISGTRPVAEAIITAGGINVKEINPKTMESKIVKNLYFAGEALDVSALTGGYNLQIAFSTGYAAGVAAG